MTAFDTARKIAGQALPASAKESLKRLASKAQDMLPPFRFSFAGAPAKSAPSPYPFAVAKENYLEQLGEKYQPTKRQHNYLPFYWMHFRDIRLEVKRVLEIGVQSDRSIRLWEEFFPNATIYGADIDPRCKHFEGGRKKIFIGDQGDVSFLQRVVDDAKEPFDIVIDDGSHFVEHQLLAFDFLFPKLSSHGIYVVEDTGGCVGDPGLRTVNALKNIVNHVMYWPDRMEASRWIELSKFPEDASWIDRNAIGVAFYRWIVFVMRGRNPEDNIYLGRKPA